MPSPADLYEQLLSQSGGDTGAAFTATELGRARDPQAPDMLKGLTPEELVTLNRYAQSYDLPLSALLAAPYEGLKGLEQKTGLPTLTGPAKAMNALGASVALPDETTSPASGANVMASLQGGLAGLLRGFRRGQRT